LILINAADLRAADNGPLSADRRQAALACVSPCQITGGLQMTTIIRGNEKNVSVFDDNSIGDTITIGDGHDDFVSANN
jgi:hypothetical protein